MGQRDEAALRAVLEGLPDATVGAGARRPDRVRQRARRGAVRLRARRAARPADRRRCGRSACASATRATSSSTSQLEHPLRFTERAYGLRSDGSRVRRRDELGDRRDRGRPAAARDRARHLRAPARPSRGCAGSPSSRRRWRRSASARCAAPTPARPRRARRSSACARRCGADRVAVARRARARSPPGARWGGRRSSVSVPIHTGDRGPRRARRDVAGRGARSATRRSSFLRGVANVLAIGFARLRGEEQMRHAGAARPADRAGQPRAVPRPARCTRSRVAERDGAPAPPCCSSTSTTSSASTTSTATPPATQLLIALAARLVGAVRPGRHRRAARRRRVRGRLRGRRRARPRSRSAGASPPRSRSRSTSTGSEHRLAASIGIALGSGAGDATPTR